MADRNASRDKKDLTVAVIGLGRFGTAVANSLVHLGHEVLGIDENPDVVQSLSEELTHVVEADSTNIHTLRRLGLQDVTHAVVGIGSNIEASALTVVALSDLGVKDIWAKAVSESHGRILEKMGATHVLYPEAAMGERVAHLVAGHMIDFIEFEDGFAIVKTRVPRALAGKTMAELDLGNRFGIAIVAVKSPRQDISYPTAGTVVQLSDLLIVSGPTVAVERFAAMT